MLRGSGQWLEGWVGHASRLLEEQPQEDARLRLGVQLATERVSGCDHASVTLVDRQDVRTAAANSRVGEHGDRLQYECGEGPCLEAARVPSPVLSQDLRLEDRWPRWSPRVVAEVGVRSVLSLPLYTSRRSFGSLNLYAHEAGCYHGGDVAVAEDVAAQLAVALAAGREIEQRSTAMSSRTVIGQAQGLLMERFALEPDQAFGYLRQVSQHQNRKLVDVASELVRTRVLPAEPPR